MAGNDSRTDGHAEALNAWHLRFSMCVDVANHLLGRLEGSEWESSMAQLVSDELARLVEVFPFPGRSA